VRFYHHREATLARHMEWLKDKRFVSYECFWNQLARQRGFPMVVEPHAVRDLVRSRGGFDECSLRLIERNKSARKSFSGEAVSRLKNAPPGLRLA